MNPRLKLKREDSPLFDLAEAKQRAEFARIRTGGSDPTTSYIAACSVARAATTQRAEMMALFQKSPGGLTSDEIDHALGWKAATAARRMHELVKLGAIRSIEATRRTRGGRAALVYEAT